jgi:hypothetical protein
MELLTRGEGEARTEQQAGIWQMAGPDWTALALQLGWEDVKVGGRVLYWGFHCEAIAHMSSVPEISVPLLLVRRMLMPALTRGAYGDGVRMPSKRPRSR